MFREVYGSLSTWRGVYLSNFSMNALLSKLYMYVLIFLLMNWYRLFGCFSGQKNMEFWSMNLLGGLRVHSLAIFAQIVQLLRQGGPKINDSLAPAWRPPALIDNSLIAESKFGAIAVPSFHLAFNREWWHVIYVVLNVLWKWLNRSEARADDRKSSFLCKLLSVIEKVSSQPLSKCWL